MQPVKVNQPLKLPKETIASLTCIEPENSIDIDSLLGHLQALVSFDTQNPPRALSVDSPIFSYLKSNLPGFTFSIYDSGSGCISLLAIRGTPDCLFNFHIDTVPAGQGWQTNPFELTLSTEKVIGLGACDIKGASACMLLAAKETSGDLGLLFSSDEEHGSSTAIKDFLKTQHGFKQVIVAEPTQAKAVLAHRGIQTAAVKFTGIGGHGSQLRALTDNAIHQAAKWSSNVIDWLKHQAFSFDNLQGLPFNIGHIEGGVKPNMIAQQCQLKFGLRPLPGQDGLALLNAFPFSTTPEQQNLTEQSASSGLELTPGFSGPSLPAASSEFSSALSAAESLATSYQLPLGKAVDFWTEASLFSQAGLTALVYGPGNIEQAHSANEWVAIEQLVEVTEKYITIINQNDNQGKAS